MDSRKEEPGYFAVLPANVRYDKSLPPYARLLYAEISSLCNKKGFCWAGNAYFASLYETSERSVINWINSLKEKGYITVSFRLKPGTRLVDRRILRLSTPPGPPEKNSPGQPEGGEDISAAPGAGFQDAAEKGTEGGEAIFTTPGKDFHHVVNQFSKGGENCFMYNININNKAAAANIKAHENGKAAAAPHEKKGPEDAGAAGGVNGLKPFTASLDPPLFLEDAFFPRALDFLSSRGLNSGYVSWMHKLCVQKRPKDLSGYFFSVFFKERYIRLFEHEAKAAPPPQKSPPVSCPACGASHDAFVSACPSCGLPGNAGREAAAVYKKLLLLPEEKRAEYFRREKGINDEFMFKDFEKARQMLDGLNKEFGLSGNRENTHARHP